jgi:hypothetical protein
MGIWDINKKYICIGLQDYRNKNQKNGFSLIDIDKISNPHMN